MVDVRALTDVGSDTDDGIVHLAIGQRATVRDDGVLNLAVLNLGRRQISRAYVDWRIQRRRIQSPAHPQPSSSSLRKRT